MNLVIELTEHAKKQIVERKIKLEWLEEAMLNPIHSEPHETDTQLTYAYGEITDDVSKKDRVLKVVYNKNTTPWRIITCHFDRNARKRFLC